MYSSRIDLSHLPPRNVSLSDDLLHAIWQQHDSAVVRRLLWELRHVKDENQRLRSVFIAAATFGRAVSARGGVVGDPQLQVYWNRVRHQIDGEEAIRRRSTGS
jgi:hypothetical protein